MPLRPPRVPRARIRPDRWRALPVVVRDGVGALLLLVLSLLPLGVPGVALGELHRTVPAWLPPILIAGQSLPLALRRIRPALGLALIGIAFAATQLTGADTGLAGLGLLVAMYSLAAHRARVMVAALVTAVAYGALAVALHAEGSPERPVDWVTFFFVLAVPWLIGRLVCRRLADQAAREIRVAEEAVQRARTGLARDLHDIVTHHVTAIVVQAESAAYLESTDVAGRASTLEAIGASGRHALQELRSLLGALEQTAAEPHGALPEPLPGDLRGLVEQARAMGHRVTLRETGPTTAVSEPVAVTLYRVAQETVTNAMRHAPGQPVAISLTAAAGRVELVVANPVPDTVVGPPGRGRRGMAERVALLGGRFDAGVADGRFEVRVRLDAEAEP